jgi:endonuclease/exonuclease/phosphatase family metal-dependent hydrolase
VAGASLLLVLLPGCRDPSSDPAADAGPIVDGSPGDTGALLFRKPSLAACVPGTPAPERLRIVSWNVHAGRTMPIQRVAQELVRVAPDIVLIQEIDVGTVRSGSTDQPQVLADALAMPHAFAAAYPFDGGFYGLALHARFPFQDVQVRFLDPTGAGEQRIALSAWLCVGATTLRAVNVHLDNISRDSAARNAVESVQWVNTDLAAGAVLAGDFNADPTDPGPQGVVAAGLVDVLGRFDPRPTLLQRRIDYVFADARLAAGVTAARVESSDASDHLPLVVDLEVPAR